MRKLVGLLVLFGACGAGAVGAFDGYGQAAGPRGSCSSASDCDPGNECIVPQGSERGRCQSSR